MEPEQIEKVHTLCKGCDVSKILLWLRYYKDSEIEDMANYFGCPNDRQSVATRLRYF